MGRIVIAEPDPGWPARFEHEAARLRDAFGRDALRIEHVGSTAVPGLAAKPVIDIQLSVATLESIDAHRGVLESLGYRFVPCGDFDRVYPFFCRPGEWPATHHVHLCEAGGEQERRHLAFRDLLRAHADVATDYLVLKQRLALLHDGDSFASREAYSIAKGAFVEAAIERAYAEGLPVAPRRG